MPKIQPFTSGDERLPQFLGVVYARLGLEIALVRFGFSQKIYGVVQGGIFEDLRKESAKKERIQESDPK